MPDIKNKVIAIVGATSSGKTSWAKKLALKFSAKIISADSRQIYRGFDIGTGKDKSFRQELIDIINPDQTYSVAEYQRAANALINQYLRMKSLPMLVGGSGLYLDAVLHGYVIPSLKKESLKLRTKLEKQSAEKLYQQLEKLDPAAAKKIDKQNKRRIIRALEVSLLSKRPFSSLQKKIKPKFKTLVIGIKTDRETLYSKIDARVEQMIKDGLVEEMRDLLKKYRADLPSLNTIGYKEIGDYLRGKITLREAIAKIKTNTHAYVRRQETWFKRDKNIKWVKTYDDAEKLIQKFLTK